MHWMGVHPFLLSVQKYLMKKLDLPREDQVEIRCMVIPTLQLHSLVELWLQTVSIYLQHQKEYLQQLAPLLSYGICDGHSQTRYDVLHRVACCLLHCPVSQPLQFLMGSSVTWLKCI